MRPPLIAGNWKMNGSLATIRTLVAEIKQGVVSTPAAEMAVFPPFPYLSGVAHLLSGTCIKLGAQNLATESGGAYTGEVSGTMLNDYNCAFVIIGHSERRSLYGETDAVVAQKFARALSCKLTPILCVGETLQEREAGVTEQVIGRQIDAVLTHCGIAAFANAVIAYEPVWAIGTGRNATPEQAQAVHAAVRTQVGEHDPGLAAALRILYGGSMKGSNARELLTMPDIDGGLVGGASLVADEFLTIYRAGLAAAEI